MWATGVVFSLTSIDELLEGGMFENSEFVYC